MLANVGLVANKASRMLWWLHESKLHHQLKSLALEAVAVVDVIGAGIAPIC
jgi:hypothetical protein